jgi:hypothetical protein
LEVSARSALSFATDLGLTSGGDELDVAGVSCELAVSAEAEDVVLAADRAPEISRSYSSFALRAFSLATRSASAFLASTTEGALGKNSAYPARDMSDGYDRRRIYRGPCKGGGDEYALRHGSDEGENGGGGG